jgi:uncharacterized DUF497 family protein
VRASRPFPCACSRFFVYTEISLKITFDPNKREKTLRERGIDFLEATEVFDGHTYDQEDDRFDYCEVRMITVGRLRGRMMVVVWTPREGGRHVISMRKANE